MLELETHKKPVCEVKFGRTVQAIEAPQMLRCWQLTASQAMHLLPLRHLRKMHALGWSGGILSVLGGSQNYTLPVCMQVGEVYA